MTESKRPFDERKARMVTNEGVVNLDFRDMSIAAGTINHINGVKSDLKGADVRDIEDLYSKLGPDVLRNDYNFFVALTALMREVDEKNKLR